MKFFKTIQGKLVTTFISVLVVMQLIIWGFTYTQVHVVNNYAKISDNMITSYDILENSDSLIKQYIEVLRDPGNKTLYTDIADYEADVRNQLDELENTISNPTSQVTFLGFKNIINNILDDTDAGLKAVEEDDLVAAYNYYDSLVRNHSYAREAASTLIFNELNATEALHEGVIRDRNLYLFSGFVALLVTNISALIYSLFFINRTTSPIITLSRLSKDVADGKYEKNLPEEYLKKEDEIGTLSRSLQLMIKKLTENIKSLDKSNKEILQAQEDLKKTNTELEKINQVMTGRELKMVELKKEIERLKKKEL